MNIKAKKIVGALLVLTTGIYYGCDKINEPVTLSQNSENTITDIRVENATTTLDDISTLKLKISVSPDHNSVIARFTWHGVESESVIKSIVGTKADFMEEPFQISAPPPYGVLSFLYTASVSDSIETEIDFPIPYTPVSPLKKVYVEDYTGRKCGNCPRAARLIYDSLIYLHPGQLVPVAVHAGFYAKPENPPSCFSEDFRSATGDELDGFFHLTIANPTGMINRVGYPGAQLKYYTQWNTFINQELAQPNNAYIGIISDYDEPTRTANITLSGEFLNALTGDYKLALYLAQDSIIACQEDYDLPTNPQTDTNYVHHHVLRGAVNSTFGDDFVSAPQTNIKFIRKFSYTIPSNFDETHCSVIALIYDAANYHVLQAEEQKIKE